MVTILQNVGQNFRLVGPLTLTNMLVNPNFDATDVDGVSTLFWNEVHYSSLTTTQTLPAYGNNCGALSISGDGNNTYAGISQEIDMISQETDYMFLQSFRIPNAVPKDIVGQVQFFGFDGTPFDPSITTLVQANTPNPNWVNTSMTVTSPLGAASVVVSILANVQGLSSFLPTFYVAKTMFSSVANQYIDGDTAGYVWAGNRFTSTTLQSTFPGDLHFFAPQLVALT